MKLVSFDVWHKKLGHPFYSILHHIVSYCNLLVLMKFELIFCSTCQSCKCHALPFQIWFLIAPNHLNWSTLIFGHLLLFPPFLVTLIRSFLWMIIDVLGSYTHLKTNLKLPLFFPIFKAFVENQFQSIIKKIQLMDELNINIYTLFFINGALILKWLVLMPVNKME